MTTVAALWGSAAVAGSDPGFIDEWTGPPLHPVCVHFAIALTVIGLIFDHVGNFYREAQWQLVGRWNLLAGAGALGLAVLSGWLEMQLPQPASKFDDQIRVLVEYHEYGGYALFGFFAALAVLRTQIAGRIPVFFSILSLVGLGGLVLEGYSGAELVYRYGAGVRAVHVLSECAPPPATDTARTIDGRTACSDRD